jgi:hypothetical protein
MMQSPNRIEELAARKAKAKKAAPKVKGMPPMKGFQGGVGEFTNTSEGRKARKNLAELYKGMNK